MILIGISLLFGRMARKSKKRLERAKQQPPPKPGKWPHESKFTIKHRHACEHDDYVYSLGSDCDSDFVDNTNDSRDGDDESGSEASITDSDEGDDDNEYAQLFSRWRWHRHIPGVRWFWKWKLYEVRSLRRAGSRRQHRLRKGQEKWEWDYPVRRWRERISRSIERFATKRRALGRSGLLGTVGKSEPGPKMYYREGDDLECRSEDERMRRDMKQVLHRERVQGRRAWLAGLFGLKSLGRIDGDGGSVVVANDRVVSSWMATFRKRRCRERDVEMGLV